MRLSGVPVAVPVWTKLPNSTYHHQPQIWSSFKALYWFSTTAWLLSVPFSMITESVPFINHSVTEPVPSHFFPKPIFFKLEPVISGSILDTVLKKFIHVLLVITPIPPKILISGPPPQRNANLVSSSLLLWREYLWSSVSFSPSLCLFFHNST